MRKKFGDIDQMGKIPPQSVDFEEAILGVIMVDKEGLETALTLLNGDCFYKEPHKLIFNAIKALVESKEPVDILTVKNHLKKEGNLDIAGGAFYLAKLTESIVSSANVEYHSRVVVENYLKREIIRVSQEYFSRGYDEQEDVFDTMDELFAQIEVLRNYGVMDMDAPFSVQVEERIKEKEKMINDKVFLTGISTGNSRLDGVTSGFNKGDLVIVAANSGEGKSVKGLNYATIAAKENKVVAVFSLEMTKEQLIDRLIVEQCQVNLQDYRQNRITQYQINEIKEKAKAFKKLPIHLFDKSGINTRFIERSAKGIIKKSGKLDMIVVDYIQIMQPNENIQVREQAVASISRDLKTLAKELGIPIIALSQLNKEQNKTGARRPSLNSLRESAAIGNDADLVLFVYRPFYHFDYGTHPDIEYSKENISQYDYEIASELIIGKNRNGPLGMIKEKFFGMYSSFQDRDAVINDFDPFSMSETPPDNSDITNLFNPAPF